MTHVRAAAVGGRPAEADIEAAFDAAAAAGGAPFKAVTITHVDTSTAVLMDVKVRNTAHLMGGPVMHHC